MTAPQRFVVQVDDRSHEVEIHADGRVCVDGEMASWSRSGDGRTLIRQDSGHQNCVVLDHGVRPARGCVEGLSAKLVVRSAAEAALDAALGAGGAGSGDGRLNSPMPGRIVKISTELGAQVEAGSPVIIIEAMKMENELVAPVAGRVASIEVEVGQAVESGFTLMVIEPESNAEDA